MLSKTKLFAALAEIAPDLFADALKAGLKAKGISNETYGRKSMIYIGCQTPERRKQIEAALTTKGFKVNHGYYPGSANAEIQVSYFKGWHHAE